MLAKYYEKLMLTKYYEKNQMIFINRDAYANTFIFKYIFIVCSCMYRSQAY